MDACQDGGPIGTTSPYRDNQDGATSPSTPKGTQESPQILLFSPTDLGEQRFGVNTKRWNQWMDASPRWRQRRRALKPKRNTNITPNPPPTHRWSPKSYYFPPQIYEDKDFGSTQRDGTNGWTLPKMAALQGQPAPIETTRPYRDNQDGATSPSTPKGTQESPQILLFSPTNVVE